MLHGLIGTCGASPHEIPVARDNREDLEQKIKQGLAGDILIMSGGVSAGVLDLVPSSLTACGVQQVFHKVNLKPGKPIWFGVANMDNTDSSSTIQAAPRKKLVFGLPGNPVSSLVCFYLFVLPAIWKSRGLSASSLTRTLAKLTQETSATRGPANLLARSVFDGKWRA